MTSTEYRLPQMPLGGAEYTIVRWLKHAGDYVSDGDPLLVVVNDSLEAALPALYAGVFERALAAEGAPVMAGAPVATIVVHSVANSIGRPDAAHAAVSAIEQPIAEPAVRISPVARRIANLNHVDIIKVHGTGVSGWIVKSDILAALAGQSPKSEALPATLPPIPHPASLIPHPAPLDIYVLTAIDVDLECVALGIARSQPSFARRGLELNYRVCVAWAVVAALSSHSLLNSSWADGMILVRRRVHLAVVPGNRSPTRAVCDAQDLNLRGLARGLGGAAADQRSADSTFTIVDLGDQLWGDPSAWARGGAAALGIGAVRARPLAITESGADRVVVRHAALLTLAYDARVIGQCHADAFLRDIKRRLEQFHF